MTTLDRPVKVPTFQAVSLRRKITEQLATVLVTLSLLIALVPLVWVLYSVITKGSSARHVAQLVDQLSVAA